MEEKELVNECGPASTIRKAFEFNIIKNAQEWMDMLKDRNMTAQTYEEDIAKDIYIRIKNKHIDLLHNFITQFETKLI